jgi:hypothetical protein
VKRSRAAPRPLWLIVKHDNDQVSVLTIQRGSDREALPVFSFEEEAETFLWLGRPGTCWRARETAAGELVSVLYGPCTSVKKVALDPLPIVDAATMVDLVSLSRERFLQSLVGENEPSAPQSQLQQEVFTDCNP